jgi:parvulin-like peptidyl-prolyl isomerase
MKIQISLLLLPVATLLGQTPAPKPVAPAGQTTAPPAIAPKPAPAVPDTSAIPGDTVIITVGPEKVTKAQWEQFLSILPDRVQAEARGPNRRKMAEQLVEVKAMAQEAQKRKLDQTPKFQTQMALQRDNLLAQALYQELTTNVKADDAALQKYYQDNKSKYETVTARHILIRMKGSPVPLKEGKPELTEEQALAKAQELKKKLDAGAKFDELAKAESDDTGSAANGGVLGTFGHGQMVPAFDTAAFAQPVGKVSDPVKTQFGYHLILVDERKNKSFEEAKSEIETQIRPELTRKAVDSVKGSATTSINDAYFGK